MTQTKPHQPDPTLPLAGRVAQLAATPRSEAREGGFKPKSLAQKLRADPTVSEIRMWRILYGLRVDGYHFRKQVQLGPYVVDFACLHAKLVIEVDGITHQSEAATVRDAKRDAYLRSRGFVVLRFGSDDVMKDALGIGDTILAALVGKPRNRRSTATPSRAPLGPRGPSSATLPARGRAKNGTIEPHSTSPLAGEVALLEAKPRSEARRGGTPPKSGDEAKS